VLQHVAHAHIPSDQIPKKAIQVHTAYGGKERQLLRAQRERMPR